MDVHRRRRIRRSLCTCGWTWPCELAVHQPDPPDRERRVRVLPPRWERGTRGESAR